MIENYKYASKKKVHQMFFSILQKIKDDSSLSQNERDIAENLIKNKVVSILQLLKTIYQYSIMI